MTAAKMIKLLEALPSDMEIVGEVIVEDEYTVEPVASLDIVPMIKLPDGTLVHPDEENPEEEGQETVAYLVMGDTYGKARREAEERQMVTDNVQSDIFIDQLLRETKANLYVGGKRMRTETAEDLRGDLT